MTGRIRWWTAGALALAVALATAPLSMAGASESAAAPLLGAGKDGVIPGRYIVVLEDGASDARIQDVAQVATDAGGTVGYTYQHTIKGFSAALPAAALDAVRHAAGVKYVETDGQVSISGKQKNPPSWGLDRVDQRSLPLKQKYRYVNSGGSGVDVYVIDTGMRFTHNDFTGRITSGIDVIDGGTADDCHGHGTHVGGTAVGTKYGVAKKASVIAVRVLDCGGFGTWEGIIAGVDWVTANFDGPSVANMSIQGPYDQAVNDAITASVAAGVVHVVAAGNFSSPACDYSPGSTPDAITVGASNVSDTGAWFSNYGTCLDLWAPGEGITSAWHTGDDASNVLDGTSMASPHVAGIAALYLGRNSTADPMTVRDAIVDNASVDKLSGIGTGSPNLLAWSKVNRY